MAILDPRGLGAGRFVLSAWVTDLRPQADIRSAGLVTHVPGALGLKGALFLKRLSTGILGIATSLNSKNFYARRLHVLAPQTHVNCIDLEKAQQ